MDISYSLVVNETKRPQPFRDGGSAGIAAGMTGAAERVVWSVLSALHWRA